MEGSVHTLTYEEEHGFFCLSSHLLLLFEIYSDFFQVNIIHSIDTFAKTRLLSPDHQLGMQL